MIIECGKGHLYDPDQYEACPYCNQMNQTAAGVPVGAESRTMPIGAESRTMPIGAESRTMPVGAESRTMPIGTGTGGYDAGGVRVTEAVKTLPPRGYDTGGVRVTEAVKTLPPRGYASGKEMRVDDLGKTVGILQGSIGFDPMVGWIVCIEGENRGKAYELKGRINTIGRNTHSDIVIDDPTVSSENHAQIGYGERSNQFTLIPDRNKNYIYLNGKEVFSPTMLSAYDIIEFGKTKFAFVPLCCEKFHWGNAGNADETVS